MIRALCEMIANVPYMSSSYVRLLAKAMVEADRNGRSVAVRASAQVYRLLQLGGIDKVGHVEFVRAH